MSIILFAFLGRVLPRRDVLLLREETREEAIERFANYYIPEEAKMLTNGVSKVRWGWMDIDKVIVALCLVDYKPVSASRLCQPRPSHPVLQALDPLVLRETRTDLTKHFMHVPFHFVSHFIPSD